MTEYQAHIDNIDQISDGEVVQVLLQDLTAGAHKYTGEVVKIKIFHHKDKALDGDTLWVRSPKGIINPQPRYIQIVERIGDYLPGRPYTSN